MLYRRRTDGSEHEPEVGSTVAKVLEADPDWERVDGPGRGLDVPSLGRLDLMELGNLALDRGLEVPSGATEEDLVRILREESS